MASGLITEGRLVDQRGRRRPCLRPPDGTLLGKTTASGDGRQCLLRRREAKPAVHVRDEFPVRGLSQYHGLARKEKGSRSNWRHRGVTITRGKSMTQKIGFIGIGMMGHGMAKNLLAKGFALTFKVNRNRDKSG